MSSACQHEGGPICLACHLFHIDDRVNGIPDETTEYCDRKTGADTADEEHTESTQPTTGQEQLTVAPSAELIAVAPGCKLRPKRLTDSDQFRALT